MLEPNTGKWPLRAGATWDLFYPLYEWGSHVTRMQITNGPEHMKPCVHAFFHVKRRKDSIDEIRFPDSTRDVLKNV